MRMNTTCKCVVSFLWTNAIVAGSLVFLLYTFVDPVDVAHSLQLVVNEGTFRIKVYFFSFFGLWILFSASTFLNCYFDKLRQGVHMFSSHTNQHR